MPEQVTQEMWDELNEKYEKLKLSEEIYRVAIGLTDHIISVVNIKERATYQIYNEGIWFSLTSKMENAPDSIIATGIIHPDDEAEFRRYYDDMCSGKEYTDCEIRSKDDKRGWLWFKVYSKTIYNEDETPNIAVAFSDDITSKKMAKTQYEQYRDVVAADADFIWEINLTQNIVTANEKSFDVVFNQTKDQTFDELYEVSTSFIPDPEQKNAQMRLFQELLCLKLIQRLKGRSLTLIKSILTMVRGLDGIKLLPIL